MLGSVVVFLPVPFVVVLGGSLRLADRSFHCRDGVEEAEAGVAVGVALGRRVKAELAHAEVWGGQERAGKGIDGRLRTAVGLSQV